jgi:hypothetical protein
MQNQIDEMRRGRPATVTQAAAPAPAEATRGPRVSWPAPKEIEKGEEGERSVWEVESLPFYSRRCGILGGFPRDSEDEEVRAVLTAFSRHWGCRLTEDGIKVPFALGSTGRLGFETAQDLRRTAARNKAEPFLHKGKPLWFGVSKSYEERLRDKSLRAAHCSVLACMQRVPEEERTRVRICYGSYTLVVGRYKLASWNSRVQELDWHEEARANSPLRATIKEMVDLALQV